MGRFDDIKIVVKKEVRFSDLLDEEKEIVIYNHWRTFYPTFDYEKVKEAIVETNLIVYVNETGQPDYGKYKFEPYNPDAIWKIVWKDRIK